MISKNHLIFSTRFGDSAIRYREKPFIMTEILLPCPDREFLMNRIGKNFSRPGSHQNAVAVSKLIILYFNGKPVEIPWEWMEMEGLTDLQRAVLSKTAEIPYGQVRTYKDIAESIGRPRACRFVGTALAKNPFPVLIPCHRVIRSDGSTGKFGGGTELKEKMIRLEMDCSF
jgi:methylated-DNA-[protein]-cysteine S-methyltransferase